MGQTMFEFLRRFLGRGSASVTPAVAEAEPEPSYPTTYFVVVNSFSDEQPPYTRYHAGTVYRIGPDDYALRARVIAWERGGWVRPCDQNGDPQLPATFVAIEAFSHVDEHGGSQYTKDGRYTIRPGNKRLLNSALSWQREGKVLLLAPDGVTHLKPPFPEV